LWERERERRGRRDKKIERDAETQIERERLS